ncbi:MAG: hypothetical protein NTX03_03120 [Bacteroidetes bacterium]|nr:hypothetical protein [Bacteroidota bacterium]
MIQKTLQKALFLAFIGVFALSTACTSGNKKTTSDGSNKDSIAKDSIAKKTEEKKLLEVKSGWEIKTTPNRKFDDIARLISGMKSNAGSGLDSIEKNPSWVKYAANSDSAWAKLEKTRLVQMRKWRDEELSAANSSSMDVFYPFSGPDFLNVYTLFPNAKSYTFLALEPAGELPTAKKLSTKNNLDGYLNSVSKSIYEIFNRSYFITSYMAKDLSRNSVNGALPIICLFMERTGNTIVNVERVRIDKTGNVVAANTDSSKRKLNHGVRVYYKTAGSEELRMVQYFSADVSDEALVNNPGMVAFLDKLPEVNCYVKAASYLMHYKSFNVVRTACLKHSKHLMQDDSGIAYRFFEKGKWDFRLYGKYYKPIKDFSGVDQPDLKAAYQKDSAIIKPVPFILGYHWRSHEAPNLMIADRK